MALGRRVAFGGQNGCAYGRISLIAVGLSFVGFVLFFGSPSELFGQGFGSGQRQRILDEPFRLQMDESVPTDKRMVFDWGGWFRSSYWALEEDVDRNFDGSSDGDHVLRRQQLRLWGNVTIDQVHQFYGRMKLDYLDWNHGTSFDGKDDDWVGANLERGWYDFRLSRAQWSYGQEPGDFDLGVKVGRQYVELGTGLALSIPLDAVLLSAYYRDWQFVGLGALSIPSTDNIDWSRRGDTEEERRYLGVQINYNGQRDHTPFVYYLVQDDRDTGLVRYGKQFGYDSQYVGLGSRGVFFNRDLQYSCEAVGEFVFEGDGAAGVDDDDVGADACGFFHRAFGDLGGGGLFLFDPDGDIDLFAEHLELLAGCDALEVG